MENSLTPKEIHELVLEKTKREMPECEQCHKSMEDAEIIEDENEAGKLLLKVNGCCTEYNEAFRNAFTMKLITEITKRGGL